jgi:long-chain acyl-CoA synthetase
VTTQQTARASAREAVDEAVASRTVPRSLLATLAARADEPSLRWRAGESWQELTWSGYAEQTARLAGALASLGVDRGERVLLMIRNRPEFHVLDTALQLRGAIPISVYNSSSPDQIRYVAEHAEARLAVAENLFTGRLADAGLAGVIDVDEGFAELLTADPADLEQAAAGSSPDDLATIIYTSGTTGKPKGVMISQRNVCWTNESFGRCLEEPWTGLRLISFLPMAHIAERMTTHYDHVVFGSIVTTCPDPAQLGQYLRDVRPEVFFGAPRVWEKLQAGLQAGAAATDGGAALERALAVGRRVAELRIAGRAPDGALAAEWEAVRGETVHPTLALVGLDECRLAITGSAPTPAATFWFFLSLGLVFSEIYGLSETTGPHTWEPYEVRPGTVGPPMPGCEVKLADDGEVLLRGGTVFAGYLNDPEQTRAAFDDEGWFRTGDVGELDEDLFLKIVDRKKELIITAGGKNVSPAALEAEIKAHPLIGQTCVVGEGRPYVAALVVLDPDVTRSWAAARGIEATDLGELARHPEVVAAVKEGVDAANARFSSAEQVKRFEILPHEWLPDSGELTATLKLKRRGILEKYAAQIEALYAA